VPDPQVDFSKVPEVDEIEITLTFPYSNRLAILYVNANQGRDKLRHFMDRVVVRRSVNARRSNYVTANITGVRGSKDTASVVLNIESQFRKCERTLTPDRCNDEAGSLLYRRCLRVCYPVRG
jgi:hypothetical protein